MSEPAVGRREGHADGGVDERGAKAVLAGRQLLLSRFRPGDHRAGPFQLEVQQRRRSSAAAEGFARQTIGHFLHHTLDPVVGPVERFLAELCRQLGHEQAPGSAAALPAAPQLFRDASGCLGGE